jgi:hypothetical protein
MCRWIFFERCNLTMFEASQVRYFNVDRRILFDTIRSDLHYVYRYISRHNLTFCQIYLHEFCYMHMDTSQRRDLSDYENYQMLIHLSR